MIVLITGAAGFIGSHTALYLANKENINLILLDKRKISYQIKHDFYQIDLLDSEKVNKLLSRIKPDLIIHCASLVNPKQIEENPLSAYLVNVNSTINLIDACITNNINHFIYPSSVAVYGNNDSQYIPETALLNPLNVYSKTKEISEQVLQDISIKYEQFNCIILRMFRVVGTYKELTDAEDKLNLNPVSLLAQIARKRTGVFTIFGHQYATHDGTVIRDYMHIDDVMEMQYEAIKFLLTHKESHIFNCSRGEGASLLDITKAISTISGFEIPIKFATARNNEYIRQVADMTKTKNILNWEPKINTIHKLCNKVYNEGLLNNP